MKNILIITVLSIGFSSCGGSKNASSRVHEKQRTPSEIKISHLDIENNNLNLRFSYRTYRERTLSKIDCDLTFNDSNTVNLIKQFDIKLGAFSTEILNFNNVSNNKFDKLKGQESLSYSINCKINYDKGVEYILSDSVLHLAPSSDFLFR